MKDGARHRRYVWPAALLAGPLLLAVAATAALVGDGLHDEIAPADVGLVLGNTVHRDGTPSRRLAARLDRTLELYRAGTFPLVIVSGARGREGWNEAAVMRDYLAARGVPLERVVVDSAGVNTWASALHTQRLMEQRRLRVALVITQYFHVPRARLALKQAGVPVVCSAHARHFELRDLYSIPRELIGLVRYGLRRP
jgi:vancomycin permeability regulator SanA